MIWFLRLAILFVSISSFATDKFYSLPDPKTQEEALFLRRIAEFWNEGNYEIVISQIVDFLKEFPDSNFKDTLYAILGDLHLRDKKYNESSFYYSQIKDPTIMQEFFLNKLQCLRELGLYREISYECEQNLSTFISSDLKKHQKLIYLWGDALYNLAQHSPKDSPERLSLARQAKAQFESLIETDLAKDVLSPLAFTYHLLGESQKAADLYLTLAQKYPNRKEEMLFQAATLLVELDKEKAIQTFGQVCHLGKTKSAEAAYNRMILYYETNKYPEIILAKDQLLHLVPKAKLPLLHFFLGRSYFAMEDYKRAANELTLFIEANFASDEEQKISFLTLLDCANKLQENPLFENILQIYQERYPNSPYLPQAFFMKAMMNKNLSQFEEARRDFERLFAQFGNCEKREEMLYQFAHLLYVCKDWQNSRIRYKQFISEYHNSDLTPLAWRYLINASIENDIANNNCFAKEQLAADLTEILRVPNLLSAQEIEDLSFMLAKVDYEVEDYESAIAFLDPFLMSKRDDQIAAEAHLLLAYCYKKGANDLEKFCSHAEEALRLNANLPANQYAHLALYNAYLERSSLNEPFWDQAAEHLYQARASGAKIQHVNQSWLAGFYHSKVKKYLDGNWKNRLEENFEIKEIAVRATQLLEVTCNHKDALAETITLADLYGLQGEFQKQIALLEEVSENINDSDDPYKEHIHFDLAKAYLQSGMNEKALPLFDELSSYSLKNHMAAFSALQAARLRLKNAVLKSDDPNMMKILTSLKDLTIQKTFANEPLHLEAAIDYIDLQAALHIGEETDVRLPLFEKALHEFKTDEDLLSKDYQIARQKMPEKEHLYLSYLNLMEAELLLIKAHQAKKQENIDEETKLKNEANALLTTLISNPPTAYIQTRAQKALKSMYIE